jgi:hypothetical protein
MNTKWAPKINLDFQLNLYLYQAYMVRKSIHIIMSMFLFLLLLVRSHSFIFYKNL